ncbi:hypothetical protein [Leifsonia sp. SIMBA_070]|uniref:hypothetical protein n=1 Tax=Leifsonia sp. SIMBA_070 TaxID=3085810 RepID=UPI00397BB18D
MTLRPRDITDISFEAPEGWYDVETLSEDPRGDWPDRLAATFGGEELRKNLAPALQALQQVLHAEDPSGATQARVFIPFPAEGVITAYQTYELLQLEVDDTPESYLAATDAEAEHREPGYEIRGYRSWRSAHPIGELVGFTHLTALDDEEAGDALLEQRVVFAIFPVGAAQAVQLVFRSAFIGGFDDMVEDTQEIAESVRVSLGEAA